MRPFMDEDFLLETETARHLYHAYAEQLPIIDYHCHLTAKEIYENRPAVDLAELWLGGDHYKWRAMRANGISEEKITGSASGYEKYRAYADTLPYAIGNPLYHWSHLELKRYFGVTEPLNGDSADRIWQTVQARLEAGENTPQHFITRSHVYALCTTDDPADDLRYHHLLAEEGFATRVLPAWRPDQALAMEKPGWREYLKCLSDAAGVPITSLEALKQALRIRMDAFAVAGCVASDHGMEYMPHVYISDGEAEAIFHRALRGERLTAAEQDGYKTTLLLWLAKEYHRRGWAMEMHVGSVRSVNQKMVARLGEATGYDAIGDHPMALAMGSFMDRLEQEGMLPKMILFSLNDKDNQVLAAMAGTFQDDSVPGKIQLGTAWWFQDHKDGMEKQMRDLANVGLLGRFIGMLTDSRSFLSYPRHEYFRRILCNVIGRYVENGQFPADEATLRMLVEGVCFHNAKGYFGLD